MFSVSNNKIYVQDWNQQNNVATNNRSLNGIVLLSWISLFCFVVDLLKPTKWATPNKIFLLTAHTHTLKDPFTLVESEN